MLKERFLRIGEVLDRRQPDLTVLMERVNKPHNFSAILRNCDAVGILEVHAVVPEGGLTSDPTTSAGTDRWIQLRRHEDGVSAVRALQEGGFQVIAADLGPGSVDYREIDYTRPTALLMGAELYGVSEDALRAADRSVHIPMVGMARSLNVSVATAILLYEAFRQREGAGMYAACRLDPEQRSRLVFEWGYPDIARYLKEQGHPRPELDDEGQIVGDVRLPT
ncbi:MAG: tRNA (guanosine(18)-2'-O)-methyltransferase TrmH [Gemmatimonadetes bacterium]|nr:tRNA (guanosine(18)-2'-O)-methyltransferase TrmH [Gemmatimonadota bacterium]